MLSKRKYRITTQIKSAEFIVELCMAKNGRRWWLASGNSVAMLPDCALPVGNDEPDVDK
jgi:hypothetical protein